MWKRMLPALAVLLLVLAACGPAATATPQPQATPTQQAAPKPTTAPSGGGTAAPTATPKPQPTAAPAVTAKSGGVLRIANDNREPRGWDAWSWKDGARDLRVRANLNFSQLFTLATDPAVPCQLVFRPELAETWKWLSPELLEVKLRQGVKFHNKPPVNGREMTSDDVVWAATQFLKDNVIRGMEPYAPHVKKIEATDRYTVRIQLDGPLPPFLTEALVSEYGALIVPKDATDDKGRWGDPYKSYIGTGPFTFKEHVPGVRTVFLKHQDYFKKGLPYFDEVDYLIVPEMSTQVASLRSGALDMVYGPIPAPMATPLKQVANVVVNGCPQLSTISGRFYFRTDQPPFNDVRMRRAIQMAFDREGLVKSILQGQGVTAPHYPNAVNKIYVSWEELPPETLQWVKYDPQRAKQLVAEAGYANGLTIGLKLSTGYASPYRELSEATVGFLKEVGITVKPHFVTAVEWAAYSNSGDIGDDQLAFGQIASLPAPTSQFSAWSSKGPVLSNRSRINDPELDKMLDQLLVETDMDKMTALFKKMETRLIDQAWEPNPGVFPLEFNGFQKYVKGFNGGHQYLATTYIERLWFDK